MTLALDVLSFRNEEREDNRKQKYDPNTVSKRNSRLLAMPLHVGIMAASFSLADKLRSQVLHSSERHLCQEPAHELELYLAHAG